MYRINSFITTDKEVASSEKRLSICLRSDGFSFSIATQNGFLQTAGDVSMPLSGPMTEQTAQLMSAFREMNISAFGFKHIELIVSSDCFVFVPANLFNLGHERDYLSMVSSKSPSIGCYSAYNADLDSYEIFAADSSIVTPFKIVLPGIDVRCVAGKMANKLLMCRSSSHPLLVVYYFDATATMLVFQDGQLLIATSRQISHLNELPFASLGLVKNLKIDNDQLELLLCGDVNRDIYGELRNYFPMTDLYCGPELRYLNPEFQHLRRYRTPF